MLRLFKYLFVKIYLFYRDILHIKNRTHLYTSFVLSLLLFANIFVLTNVVTLLIFNKMILSTNSYYYIYAGNVVMLSVLIIVSFKRRYIALVNEIRLLPDTEEKKIARVAKAYVVLSLLALVPFVS